MQEKLKTKKVQNNGLNPVWNESKTFIGDEEEINMLVFKIYDADSLGKDTVLCFNAINISCLREGIRVVNMKDTKKMKTCESSLLCQFTIKYKS